MKKQNLLIKCIAVTTFFFLIVSTSYAQLKIGNNPTTIGTNNNLEVEGTNSKKVAVKSDTGQLIVGSSDTSIPAGGTNVAVIIDNGATNGAIQIKDGTHKVLTSDANGLATCLSASSQVIYGNIVPTSQLDVSNQFLYDDNTNNLSIDLPPGLWVVNFYNQIFNTLLPYSFDSSLSSSRMNVALFRDDEPFLTRWPLSVSACSYISSQNYFNPETQFFVNNNTAITHRYRIAFDHPSFGANSSNNRGVLQGNATGYFGYFYAIRLSQ